MFKNRQIEAVRDGQNKDRTSGVIPCGANCRTNSRSAETTTLSYLLDTFDHL